MTNNIVEEREAEQQAEIEAMLSDFLHDYIHGYENSKLQGFNLEYCTFDSVSAFLDGLAALIKADRQALLSRIEANAPPNKELNDSPTANTVRIIQNEQNDKWRTAIQKERENL